MLLETQSISSNVFKAWFKRGISHVPNLIQELSACEVQRLTKIKFDIATSAASSTEPSNIQQKFDSCFIR